MRILFLADINGGPIRLFGHGLKAPNQGWFPKYTRGLYDNKLLVSSGLANTLPTILRLFNAPELMLIHLDSWAEGER